MCNAAREDCFLEEAECEVRCRGVVMQRAEAELRGHMGQPWQLVDKVSGRRPCCGRLPRLLLGVSWDKGLETAM